VIFDRPHYFEISDSALISFAGEDAAAFLHAQLTSDVLGLRAPSTQYSGYCSPKGRLLATFLVWRLENEILLQLPASLRATIQTRLARYVLRAKVVVADASSRYTLLGVAGTGAAAALEATVGSGPAGLHQVSGDDVLRATALSVDRYLLLGAAEDAAALRARLDDRFVRGQSGDWRALEAEAGIPVITESSQDEYVPQMVNLDLVGGVSLAKGCYPGQEIVARMHYLGRLKQRMYRIRVAGAADLAIGALQPRVRSGPGERRDPVCRRAGRGARCRAESKLGLGGALRRPRRSACRAPSPALHRARIIDASAWRLQIALQ
jgi:folate-binding protein YgfZ